MSGMIDETFIGSVKGQSDGATEGVTNHKHTIKTSPIQ